ncbi:glycosyltransferase family 4 protein [Paenibacillus sp. MBLB4367]|uniref:glycosyltransferase family 4 protein n=1 Tax=Paenibacillus sp. MBLB4367 TaxID=3384767 RepID=UPI0039082EEE
MESKRKLKIWVMTNEFQPNIIGGLGIVSTFLSRALSKNGVKVTVLCSGFSNRLMTSSPTTNLRLLRLPKKSTHFNRAKHSFKANMVMRAASAKGCSKPDLIHVHSTEFADTAAKAGDQFHIPIVYSCHSMASQGIFSQPGKNQAKLIRIARRIIVPSRWQVGAIKKRYLRTNRGKIVVIPHGVKPVSKRSFGAPTNLLYVGRLIPSKGIKPLIEAIALLSRRHKHVRLTIVGSGKARYQKKLRALARQVGVAKRIRWIKNRSYDAVQRMYASYGAVIVPSKTESFCLVALEAMANGVPLVSTLSGGLKEFVNTRNAQIIPSVNKASIARAIEALWRNPIKSKIRQINARSTAARYRWPAIARQYKTLFMKCRR